MSADKEFTYQDVAAHNTKKDVFVVIHDKVYDCTKFVDEHPYVFSLPLFLFLSLFFMSFYGGFILAYHVSLRSSLAITL